MPPPLVSVSWTTCEVGIGLNPVQKIWLILGYYVKRLGDLDL